MDRPDILLLVLDTARADAFEPYGAPSGSSPAIADLASSGRVQKQMYSTACWTVPSHASIFTGLMPRQAGLIRPSGGRPKDCVEVLERHRERLLPEVLRGSGYTTLGVSANLWISAESGFDRGFDRFHSVDTGRQASLAADGFRSRTAWALEGARARVDDGARDVEALLRAELEEAGAGPLFTFVNLIEAHSPYLPPRPYNPLGLIGRTRAALEARRHLTMGEIWRACAGGFDVPDAAIERMRRLYAASIRQLDDWVARLAELLDRAGRLDRTILIITSDHGENLGEGGMMGHSFSLDQRLTRVPFVVAGPADLGLSEEPRSLASLAGMICRAVGLERHPYGDDPQPAGVAVAQFDPPAGPGDHRVQRALREWGLDERALPRFTSKLTSVTDGRWKLLLRDQEEELYDLVADPLELSPIPAGSAPPELPRDRFVAALAGMTATPVSPAAGATAVAAEAEGERADLEERMKLLGYM